MERQCSKQNHLRRERRAHDRWPLCRFKSPPMSRSVPLTRASKTMLIVLALLFAGAVSFAIKAEKPWGKTVAKRLEKKQKLQPKEYAVIGLWWGAVANAGVLALLLGTAQWWA